MHTHKQIIPIAKNSFGSKQRLRRDKAIPKQYVTFMNLTSGTLKDRSTEIITSMNKDQKLFEEAYHLITERSLSLPIIIIDVQPSYDKFCSSIMADLASFLNSSKGPIVAFFNGLDVGIEDSKDSVASYYLEHGVDEEVIERIDFKEKSYAFFRNWMDAGMERKYLIKAIRFMVMNRFVDSIDVSSEQWKELFGEDYSKLSSIIESDSINLPDISLSNLKALGGCYLCGGAKDECLSEFRFLLESFNIPYKLVSSLIY